MHIPIQQCDIFQAYANENEIRALTGELNYEDNPSIVVKDQAGNIRRFEKSSVDQYIIAVMNLARKHFLDHEPMEAFTPIIRWTARKIMQIMCDNPLSDPVNDVLLFDIFSYKRLKQQNKKFYWVPPSEVDTPSDIPLNQEWQIETKDGQKYMNLIENFFNDPYILCEQTEDRVVNRINEYSEFTDGPNNILDRVTPNVIPIGPYLKKD